MGNVLKKIKDNKKSEIWENDDYKVKISDINGVFLKKNSDNYVDYDTDLEDDEYKFVDAVQLTITNKKTNKTSRKRCYQGYSIINDLQVDLNDRKKQFSDMFQKIDN